MQELLNNIIQQQNVKMSLHPSFMKPVGKIGELCENVVPKNGVLQRKSITGVCFQRLFVIQNGSVFLRTRFYCASCCLKHVYLWHVFQCFIEHVFSVSWWFMLPIE